MPDRHLTSLTIRRPDDWHLHLRDGAMLRAVLPETARHFARAIIMPNLVPPVVTSEQAVAYRARIMDALPDGMNFKPLMTLYLTETTDPEDVRAAYAAGIATAVKLYPAGATTNSDSGVRDFEKVRPVLEVYPYAWAFFIPFILVTTFAVVNLLVGLIVNSFALNRQDAAFPVSAVDTVFGFCDSQPAHSELQRDFTVVLAHDVVGNSLIERRQLCLEVFKRPDGIASFSQSQFSIAFLPQ